MVKTSTKSDIRKLIFSNCEKKDITILEMKKQGFNVNPHFRICKNIEEVIKYISNVDKIVLDVCYDKCYLETLQNMIAAQKFYEKYGFKRLEKPLLETGHFACDVCYLKDL